MNPSHATVVAGVPIVYAATPCVSCAKPLLVVQLPGAMVRHEDAACWRCVGAVKLVEAA